MTSVPDVRAAQPLVRVLAARLRAPSILVLVDCFVVRPGGPLSGRVRVGGAKNSALKLMAACLLAEGRHVLHNVARISDVDTMS